ncbi:MAG: EAL domain-containing protein [Cyanobacteria bacterium CRU_2_1]|nr:EAL domain-containing protein [Cyanobacteria bacterium RU_5_0]NJR57412.1 EAL domain-containing protein [Cyanobacteria bacterium CRU_2_1]
MTTILVIEDMLPLREEILEILHLMDFQGIGAENGTVGVELANRCTPDLIICDIMMPELDGYGVLQALRQTPETATIPFIFLTAKADRSDIRHGMNLGADDYLTKPFTSDELSEAIAARLHKKATMMIPYVMEMRRTTEQLGQMVYRDPLTGLPNRILFQQRLQEAIAESKQDQHSIMVLCIRLKQSQLVKIKLELSAIDLLLQAIAERLTNCVAAKDTVARFSGDEFSLIVPEITCHDEAVKIAEQIRKMLSEPYLIDQQSITIQVYLGATLYPEDHCATDRLLSHALMSTDWGQKHNHFSCQFYDSNIEVSMTHRRILEASLYTALQQAENKELPSLQVYYQPQVNLVTGRIVGAEALLRMQHPELGWISPAMFISIAEETDLIIPLGAWVLQTVCHQAKRWQSIQNAPIRISVNLSAHQLKQPELTETVAQILTEADLPSDWLGLELTETAVMEDVERSVAMLQTLREMGIHLSVDDFGTGYSSLSYLKRLPIDTLKIDRSFVFNATTDENDAAIVSTIITLAQSLNLRIIAEGVETREQYQFLHQRGCHAMQGYLFSPAVPAIQFEQILASDRRLVV